MEGPVPAPDWQHSFLPEWEHHVADWRAFEPGRIVLRLDEGLQVSFRVEKVEKEDARTVLTARLDAKPADTSLEGSFLVGTANAADRWDALVVLSSMEYRITVRAGSVRIEETPSLAHACAADTEGARDAGPDTAGESADPVSAGDSSTPLAIDVLFLYNQRALAERNQDTQTIDADSSNYIAASNAVLENSQINTFRWRYLGAVAAPAYQDNDDTGVDLRAMRGTGEIAAFTSSTQRAYGADQVVMLVGGVKNDAVGRAWVGGTTAHSVVNYPFPTFSDGSRSSSTTSYATTCHELGHNFGCRHQRADPGTDAADGNGLYHYGHVFPRSGGETGTMMAVYVAPTTLFRVPYFSNPGLTYLGNSLGVPADQPRAAYNALIMSDNAAHVAGLEEEVTVPTIVEQPRSQAAASGERITLSVAAAGGGLSYSWTKDGVAIPPQTASFAIVSASAASAGAYVVTVSNLKGSATSEPAVITVGATVTNTPPAQAGGSGGSGGGATPWWLVAAVLGLRASSARLNVGRGQTQPIVARTPRT